MPHAIGYIVILGFWHKSRYNNPNVCFLQKIIKNKLIGVSISPSLGCNAAMALVLARPVVFYDFINS